MSNGIETDVRLGPLLYFRGAAGNVVRLVALLVRPAGESPPILAVGDDEVRSEVILEGAGVVVYRYLLELPTQADAAYVCDGERIGVACDHGGDLRIAFASCNGQEEGDLDREADERNAMWGRMAAAHGSAPFHLLLQGGDQIYADEVTKAHPASAEWPEGVAPLNARGRAELAEALMAAFVRRYLATFGSAEYQWLAARVPTLAMWDDHDICDGWGSLAPEVLDSDVGQALFATARDAFAVFQMGEAPGSAASHALAERTFGWAVDLPGVRILAPDLRSERRPDRVMGDVGWRTFGEATEAPPERLILVSSVPVLGPRLSLVEAAMQLTPRAEKYEDDLRDQWQSRAHRKEWRRMLSHLVRLQEAGVAVTAVSGEIHLATRGEMATAAGPIHQLVASGISHPAPGRGYAWALGTLARLGESPLRGHPIRLRALPGRRAIYVAERNYLVLERRDDRWTAVWELERSGPTPALEV